MRRSLAVALTALFLLAAPAAASAAEPNEGVLVFSGTVVSDGATTDATWTFDCVDGTCTARDVIPTLVFRDGVAEPSSTEPFDDGGCQATVSSARDLTMTADGITGTSVVQPATYVCDGQATDAAGYTNTVDLALDSGDPCLIDASCAAAEAAPLATTQETGDGGYAPGGSRPFAEATELSSIPTAADAFVPANIIRAAAGAVVLAILVVVPTQFANSAADTLAGRVRERWRRWRKHPETQDAAGLVLRGWPWAAAGVLAASVIAALADPNFGFDAAGLRVFLSILASFALEVVVGWLVVALIVRRVHPAAAVSFQFAPATLLIVVGAVLLSRLSGFEPPIIFGLVAGLAIGGLAGAADQARVTLIAIGWAFGIALVAWIVYSFVPTDAVALREFLSAAAIAGISALPIALLPLSGLAGRVVWDWNWRIWLAAYVVGLFAFMLVLLPLPGSWTEVGMGLPTWIALFALYCVAAVGIWLVVARPWRRQSA